MAETHFVDVDNIPVDQLDGDADTPLDPVIGGEGTDYSAFIDAEGHNMTLKSPPTANLAVSGILIPATVDSNSTGMGCPLYLAADGNWDQADADQISTAPAIALATEAGTGSKRILLYGVARKDSWAWTIGPGELSLIFLSTTVGTLTQTAPSGTGDVIQVVGFALSADTMLWCPQLHAIEHV